MIREVILRDIGERRGGDGGEGWMGGEDGVFEFEESQSGD